METGRLEEVKNVEKGCWINLENPTDEEIIEICNKVNIEQDFIRYALDYEEKPRIDQEDKDNTTLFIIDIPTVKKSDTGFSYYTIPLGMIVVRDDMFITVGLESTQVIERFKRGYIKNFATYKKSRFILQILYENAVYYLMYLKRLNKEKEITETTLKKSMKNKELLKLLDIHNSLVYFETSLKANELVMEKTLKGKYTKLYEDDEDILEDAIIENKQAMEMSQIYSNILKGTMDAYGSIVANNLSGVMKFLTSITIFLAVPTMISGFWGMNVPVPFAENKIAFIGIVLFSVLITGIIGMWLKKKDMIN
jgi:magnesium transporter